jgi:hypothetical protein
MDASRDLDAHKLRDFEKEIQQACGLERRHLSQGQSKSTLNPALRIR